MVDVAPGYIVTDLNREMMAAGPLRSVSGQAHSARRSREPPTKSARLVAALFARDSRFLTGETIYIDGAQGIAH